MQPPRSPFSQLLLASLFAAATVPFAQAATVPPLIWMGDDVANVWDAGTTANWVYASLVTVYSDGKPAVFDDTGSDTLPVSLSAVFAPKSVTVSALKDYTFAGSGSLSGTMSLAKSGQGTLTLTKANSYTGGTVVTGGTVAVSSNAGVSALGTGPITLNGGSLSFATGTAFPNSLIVNTIGTLSDAKGTFLFNGTLAGQGALSIYLPAASANLLGNCSAFTGRLNLRTTNTQCYCALSNAAGFPAAALDLGSSILAVYSGSIPPAGVTFEIGALFGGSGSYLQGAATGKVTYKVGARGGVAVFAGSVREQNFNSATSLVKTGAGTWTLSGDSDYNGSTTVSAGVLTVSGTVASGGAAAVNAPGALDLAGGSLSAPALSIAAGASLNGFGSVDSDLVNNGSIAVSGGNLVVSGSAVNNGTLRFAPGGLLSAGSRYINNGVIYAVKTKNLRPANLVNNGVIVDAASAPVVSFRKAGASIVLKSVSALHHHYQLQISIWNTNSGWQNVGAAKAGSGQPLVFTDGAGVATEASRIYRIHTLP